MNQKTVLAIVVALIVLILIAWGISAANNESTVEVVTTASPTVSTTATSSASSSPESTNLTVTYNGSSFSPANLTIKKGQTVTFVNNSTRSMWVASDPHPVHTDYSAFDARKGYTAGTSYTFTFNETGTYPYHDHLNDDATGTIVVQ